MSVSTRQGTRLAALLGSACIAFVAAPATASADLVGHYAVDPDTGILELELLSDGEGDTVKLGCSPNGNVTNEGQVFGFGMGPIPCNGPEGIYVFGGGGNDTIDFTGVAESRFTSIIRTSEDGVSHDEVTMDGDSGKDTLTGGAHSEWLNATHAFDFGTGADIVRGNGGDDELKGSDEADTLLGGNGQDKLEPGPGKDLARGGPGGDFLDDVLDKARDRFFGEGGRDQMFGGGGGDLLDGGGGGDYMDGQGGRDRMLGRAGSDGLFGRGGADFLFGHAGPDYIRGGPGRDHIFPGPGRDDVQQ
jgi:Ca2+-binding RTX toxin-like protein